MVAARAESIAVHPRPRPFTVDEYVDIVNSGILGEDARVELIERYLSVPAKRACIAAFAA